MSKCEICGGSGYHKLSCPTQKVTFWYDKDSLDKASDAVDKELSNTFIPTLKGDEAEEFIRKADENVRLMKQRRCKNHVWRKHYLNGGKVCQVCGKVKEIPTRNKDVEE